MIPITQQQLDLIKQSSKLAQEIFRQYKIKGWPRIVTTEPGKHFLDK